MLASKVAKSCDEVRESSVLSNLLRQPDRAFRDCLLGHESVMYRAMDEDEDAQFFTSTTHFDDAASEDVETPEQWGCTKSGITENMCYLWAENEAALRVFEPLAKVVCDTLYPPSGQGDHKKQFLQLYAASFIVARPPGVREHEARPHMDWDLSIPRCRSFTVLCPLLCRNEEAL